MKGRISRQWLIIIAALLVPILPFVIIGELPGERWLSNSDDDAFMFGLTGGGLLALDIGLPVPTSIVGTLLAARLGFWPGLLTTWVGLLLGNVAGFALARYASDRFRSKLPPHPESTTVALVFVTRPVPVVAEAMSLAAGATTISTAHFLLASAAGNFVYALVLSANGSALVPESVIGWGLLVPFLFPVLAWFGWRYYAQRHGKTAETQSAGD